MALKDTIERLQASRREPETAAARVSAWQEAVSALYDRIAEWLDGYLADGRVALQRRETAAYEESLGDYAIERLDIDIVDETVRLEPRATVVIGARGRIDMAHVGSGDPVMLILSGPDDQPDWFVVDPARRRALVPLTGESFEATLDALLSGEAPRTGLQE